MITPQRDYPGVEDTLQLPFYPFLCICNMLLFLIQLLCVVFTLFCSTHLAIRLPKWCITLTSDIVDRAVECLCSLFQFVKKPFQPTLKFKFFKSKLLQCNLICTIIYKLMLLKNLVINRKICNISLVPNYLFKHVHSPMKCSKKGYSCNQ